MGINRYSKSPDDGKIGTKIGLYFALAISILDVKSNFEMAKNGFGHVLVGGSRFGKS